MDALFDQVCTNDGFKRSAPCMANSMECRGWRCSCNRVGQGKVRTRTTQTFIPIVDSATWKRWSVMLAHLCRLLLSVVCMPLPLATLGRATSEPVLHSLLQSLAYPQHCQSIETRHRRAEKHVLRRLRQQEKSHTTLAFSCHIVGRDLVR